MPVKLYDNLTVLTTADIAAALTVYAILTTAGLWAEPGLYVGNNAEAIPTGGSITQEGGSDTATTSPTLLFRRTRGTVASKTSVVANDYLGGIGFRGNYSGYYYAVANIRTEANGTWDATNRAGRLIIGIAGLAGAAVTDRMQVAHTGTRMADALLVGSMAADAAAGEIAATTRLRAGTGAAAPVDGSCLLRTYSAAGSFMHWTAAAIAGTALTIIANGAGDVTAAAFLTAVVLPSAGAANATHGGTSPGTTLTLWTDGGVNVLTLTCAADGSVTVARSAGALTYTLSLSINWL